MKIIHTRQGFRPGLADLTPFLAAKFAHSGVRRFQPKTKHVQ